MSEIISVLMLSVDKGTKIKYWEIYSRYQRKNIVKM